VSHEFTFAPPARPQVSGAAVVQPSRTLAGPLLLGATGLLAVGAGVVTGLVARSKTGDIEASCPKGICPATYDLESERGTARMLGTVTDVALIGGGALLGGAVLWYVLLPKGRRADDVVAARAARTAWASSAMCTGDGCAFQLQRGF
jgi:hypothetical protein